MRRTTAWGWPLAACVAWAGCADATRERCEGFLPRVPEGCRGEVAIACDVVDALGGACSGYTSALLTCLEAREGLAICTALSEGCPTEARGLLDCERANLARCSAFGTCVRTMEPISACEVRDREEYHVGARTFPCAAGGCSAAQAELVAYCGL